MIRRPLAPLALLVSVLGCVVAALGASCSSSSDAGAANGGDGGAREGGGTAAPPQPPGWDDDVRVAPLADENPDPDVVEVRLEAKLARVSLGGTSVEMWTYNGQVPGPTLRAKVGDRVVVHFTNSLPEPTTIHWHGVKVPNAMDGVPDVTQPAIQPGGTFDYAFTVSDAGTYWYHPHFASTAQVGYGLYGAITVDDPASAVRADDLVLVLSDASVSDAGTLVSGDAGGGFGAYFGREGNVLLVNGKPRASLRARPGLPQRWRVVNASRAHYANLKIPGFDVVRLGGDEGFAREAVQLSGAPVVVPIVPGERVELLVVPRAPSGTTATVTWDTFDRLHEYGGAKSEPLLDVSFEGDVVTGADRVPAKLADVAAVDTTGAAARAVHFTDVDGQLGIDGHVGADVPMIHVPARTTEVWTITNDTGQDHPFHLHGFGFQVLAIGSAPPQQLEMRDTVNVVAHGSVKVAIPFDGRTGTWMYHCHILDHADAGMMGMVMVM